MAGKGVSPFLQVARRSMKIRNVYVRAFLGELLGTALLTFFGVGAGFQSGVSSIHPILGSLFGLMVAILIVGGASGGHINPAVTLGLCIAGECSWIKLPVYWLAQFLGAYIGAGLAVSIYFFPVALSDQSFVEIYKTPGVLVSVPEITPLGTGFLEEILGTSILVMLIIACCDKRNMKVPPALIGFFICLTISAIAMCFGNVAGAVLNPARDFSARLMALTVGFKADGVMTLPPLLEYDPMRHWWAVGFFGPLIGGALGAVVYVLMIGAHLDDDDEEEEAVRPKSGKNGNEDWRNTRFIPPAQNQSPPRDFNPAPTHNQQGNQYRDNYGYSRENSQPHIRDDMRQRQGY